jgi:hypothetical protein
VLSALSGLVGYFLYCRRKRWKIYEKKKARIKASLRKKNENPSGNSEKNSQ